MEQVAWRKGEVRELIDNEIMTQQAKRNRARSQRTKEIAGGKIAALETIRVGIFGERPPEE